MKITLTLLILIFVLACGESPSKTPAAAIKAESESAIITDLISGSIEGERINGPANIRDTINGDIIFSLDDSCLVSCTEANNGWYAIGLFMDLPASDFEKDTLNKGTKIIVDGKQVGEVLKDIPVSTARTNTRTWAELIGFTHQDNIHPYSIIENALTEFLKSASDRSEERFLPFIKSFAMEASDEIKPFKTYLTHESWVDDPSPLLRIELIFHENKLVGVVHSRALKLPNATDYHLEREFQVLFFNDVPKQKRDDFINRFNRFIKMAD